MFCFVGVWVLGLYFRAETSREVLSRGAFVILVTRYRCDVDRRLWLR